MLVSFNWLKQYVDLPNSFIPEELALKLTMSTVEVEKAARQGKNLANIVVGKVLKVEKHPDAEKLKVCIVDDGRKKMPVVCGGFNVTEGMLIAFARVGAKLRWHGQGELVELKPAKIRGVDSFGMICSASEIGLEEMFPQKDEREILDLTDHPFPPPRRIVGASFSKGGDRLIGGPLAEVLGLDDVIFEIDNKSMTHRPDLWGHYGLAREVAAIYNKRLKEYKISEIKKLRNKEIKLTVKVEDEKLCPRYMAVAVSGIKVAPSPGWLQSRLSACGVRPINNIVDITNYVLLDLGQPMHAFDADYLNQKTSRFQRDKNLKSIIVRRAKDGEKFTTLDGGKYSLTSEMLVIADEEKAIALAGVMGGENSEINDETTTIIYESATFDATNIRRTALKLGLRTESSARFEKSLDPHNAELALRRAVQLTLEMCPGAKVASQVVDEKKFHLNQGPIELSLEFLKKKIGKEIPKKEVISILERLGFGVKNLAKLRYGAGKKEKLSVIVPSWRATKDISIPEDLVEEVARIYGYGQIEPRLPIFPITPPERNESRALERKIKNILSLEFGFTEVYNYSFVAPEVLEKMGEDIGRHLELANPLAKDRPFLRRHLIPHLLLNIEANLHHFDEIRLFETGTVFDRDNPGQRAAENSSEFLPRQNTLLSLGYVKKGDAVPFYELAAAIRGLAARLGAKATLDRYEHPHLVHNGRAAIILVKGTKVGFVSEVHPAVQERLGIEERLAIAELDLNVLLPLLSESVKYQSLSSYPAVERDIAFVVDKKQEYEKIVKMLAGFDPLLIKSELFDIYSGKGIAPDKKSLAFHISYQSPDRTLTAGEVEAVHQKLIQKMEKELGAEVRGVNL